MAFLCMVEFVERNGMELDVYPDLAEQLVGVAAGLIGDSEFAQWLAPCLHERTQ